MRSPGSSAPLRKLQYGCGLSAPFDWENYDGSPTLWLQRLPLIGPILTRGRITFPKNVKYANVAASIPAASGSVDYVYCSHVLEHLTLEDLRLALKETFRVLKPGGTFSGVMPDLAHEVDAYVAVRGAPDASINFMQSTLLGLETRPKNILQMSVSLLGNDRHLYLWDFEGFKAELERTGFTAIRRACFGDHASDAFETVEDSGRWTNCLGFECQR